MSKQVSNNPRKFLPALRTTSKEYMKLVTLGTRIVSYMTANIAFYATPNPTLASVTTQIGNLRDALGLGGSKYNRGSKASLLLIQAEAESLRSLIIALISYAVNLTTTDDSQQTQALYNYLLSGISVKKRRAVTKKNLNIVRSAKIQSQGTNLQDIIISWQKPKGMIKGQPANLYQVEIYNQLARMYYPLTETTKCSFTFTNGGGTTQLNLLQFRVTPISSTGKGQPYIFKMLNSGNAIPAAPVVISGGLGSGEIASPDFSPAIYPYNFVTVVATGANMDMYFSATEGEEPNPPSPILTVVVGAPQTMSVSDFFAATGYSPTLPVINVKNVGAVTGSYSFTFFV